MLNKNTIVKYFPNMLVVMLVIAIFFTMYFYLETTNQLFLSFIDSVNAVQNAPENYDAVYEIAMLNRRINNIWIFGVFFCGVIVLQKFLYGKKT